MKNILRLFLEDLKSLKDNVIAMIVIVGLALTPALYAWFNTLGFWDPYSNTGNIEVAVANCDEGYHSTDPPLSIEAGNQVVEALRANDQFDWIFVSEEEATEGVRSGRYYAALIIPKSFSADLMTVFSSDATPASIIYYTNQKENAIAPRLTDEGASALSAAIDKDFTKAVSEVALDASSSLMSFLNGDGFQSYSIQLVDHLDDVISMLDDASQEASTFATLVGSNARLAEVSGQALEAAQTTADAAAPLMGEADSAAAGAFDALKDAAQVFDDTLAQAESAVDDLEAALSSIPNLGDLPGLEDSDLSNPSPSLSDARAAIQAARGATTADITQLVNELSQDLQTIQGAMNSWASTLQTQNTQLQTIAATVASALDTTQSALESAALGLTASKDELDSIRDQLQTALNSGDWETVRRIIGNDPDRIASFIAAPTTLERIPVYPVANNGSAMAPFYTSLSLWIGSIFMVALMRTSVSRRRLDTLENPKLHQIYWGRYLIFAALALVQATVIGLGDLWFLGIQCVHPWLFMVTCWVAAIVFSNVIYTLTLSFSRVGEAIAVILLVLQVGGSGGIFPVVMSADIFQVIYPFLPFTHSMEAFQSCIAGIYGLQYLASLGWLIGLLVASLILGLVLRRPIIRLIEIVTGQLDQTHLFIKE